MGEENIDLKEKYSNEISEINYILNNLEKGRYYENTGAKIDGYLATNISKLREKLNDLFNKIEYKKDSTNDEIEKAFLRNGNPFKNNKGI